MQSTAVAGCFKAQALLLPLVIARFNDDALKGSFMPRKQKAQMAGPEAVEAASDEPYIIEEQVGFILRQVNQRHTGIFARRIGHDLTPTQWAAMAKLLKIGACTQNLLGRLTAMDAATVKGVVDRLIRRGFAETRPDPTNKRRLLVDLTPNGLAIASDALPHAKAVTSATLEPLTPAERELFLPLLMKLR